MLVIDPAMRKLVKLVRRVGSVEETRKLIQEVVALKRSLGIVDLDEVISLLSNLESKLRYVRKIR